MTHYFELFQLPEIFDVDESLLEQRFIYLQKQFHPDKFAYATSQMQRIAVQKSAEINQAYQVLKAPLQRSAYLIELKIGPIDDTSSFSDMAFLTLQMEWRESLSESQNASEFRKLLNEVEHHHTQSFLIISQQLEAEMWQEATKTLKKLRFIEKFRKECIRELDAYESE